MRKRRFEIAVAVLAIWVISLPLSEGDLIKPKPAKFAYSDLFELIAIKDDCKVFRWGLAHTHYATTATSSEMNGTLLSTQCSRELRSDKMKYVFPATGGTQLVRLNHNFKRESQSSFDDYYEFMFFKVEYSANFFSHMKKPYKYQLGKRTDYPVNPFQCFEDLNTIYCLRKTNDRSFQLYRYEMQMDERGALKMEREGSLGLRFPNNEIPSRILFDNSRTELIIFYKSYYGHESHLADIRSLILFDNSRTELIIFYKSYYGHESHLADIRSLYGLGRRGLLVQVPFKGEDVLAVTSFHGHRYFVVRESKGNETGLKMKIYHSIVGHRAVNPLKSLDVDYPELDNVYEVGAFIKPDYWIEDNYQTAVTKLSIDSCLALGDKLKTCQKEVLKFEGWMVLEYVVIGVLSFLFLTLVILLLLYLLCCVKTKRRRRKKRKKRRMRRHRKPDTPTTTQSKVPDDEVEVDPEAKKDDKESKKEADKDKKENTFVKKLKAFGGVDYSSSSSDEKEHSQAYFSARDTFDKDKKSRLSADKIPAANAKPGENNNAYENLGPNPNSTATTGAGPAEQEIHDKNEKQKPRSVYMKPAKKKKT
uniref:Uncharacterized protein n=1 Tax=Panagrolaimus sp. JU765 TaxID=591449 RepID=A0AC34QN58_9BILA